MQQYFGSNRQKLFIALMILEVAILICLIVAGQFSNAIMSTIIRIILLLAANFCHQFSFAIIYSVFALYCGFYLIDPIGLFLSGHSKSKTSIQNIMCIVALCLCFIAAYLSFLFSKQLFSQSVGASSRSDNNDRSFANPINQPFGRDLNRNNQSVSNPLQSYGGTNYMYQNPYSSSNAPARNQEPKNNWQPFTGEGHRLS